ncbi:hypothetical protein JX265_002042 [Neoarthrinium moseri]|uniref:AAA+ ATPase domain-containing protein n=1 Tax=Neoarthrinium moseri TaxID=1658444 RepID=A0A9P9WWQ8_9PEZI|nr:hypothetical protein JX265_002042 [Neoarthrinium moseri]
MEKNLQTMIHHFNRLFLLPDFMRDEPTSGPLGSTLADLFQTSLILVGSKETVRQHTVKRLASDEGLELIKELLSNIGQADTHQARVHLWKSQLRPFLATLCHPAVTADSLLEKHIRTVYDFLISYSTDGLMHTFSYIYILVDAWKTVDNDTTNGCNGIQVLVMSSKVLTQAVNHSSCRSSSAGLCHLIQRLLELCDRYSEPDQSKDRDLARRNLESALATVKKLSTTSGSMPGANNIQSPPEKVQDTAWTRVDTAGFFNSGLEGPGGLSPKGQRHDNDFDNIGDIRILPTPAEILSTRPEYLPVYDPSHWHVPGLPGLIDRHFRLLREDNVGSIRDAIRPYLRGSQSSLSIYQGNKLRTDTYAVQGVDVGYDPIDGFEVRLVIKQPPAVASRSQPPHREQWWVETKGLDWGNTVCLVTNDYAFFGVVSRATCRTISSLHQKKDEKKKGRQRRYDKNKTLFTRRDVAYVILNPADLNNSDIEFLAGALVEKIQPLTLIEFPTVLLASFKPMLSALREVHGSHGVPFGDLLVSVRQPQNPSATNIPPPAYTIKNKFEFDLSCITLDGGRFAYNPRKEPVVDELCRRSSLDEGQAKALLNTLRRRLALIQGPPGTGKSYTGEAIIQVLLANNVKADLGPIVCVCQTNHALDQLLEHLYVRKHIHQIVRLGSFSKSELIQSLTLQNIMDNSAPGFVEQKAIWNSTKPRNKSGKRVATILEDFRLADPSQRPQLMKQIREAVEAHSRRQMVNDEAWTNYKLTLLRRADIIGVTTTGLARFRDLLSQLKSKVILCEEAGEVLESHTLASLLPSTEHLILIGDHQQLRPHINCWDFQIANPLGRAYAGDLSLFERLVNPLLENEMRLPFDTLDIQRRMHPSISNLVRATLYPDLKDADNVKKYPPLAGFRRRLFWFHHTKLEDGLNADRSKEFSYTNMFEIEVIKTVLAHLHRQNVYPNGEIAVLTPYAGQLRQLKIHLGATYDVSMNELDATELEKHNMNVNVGVGAGRRRIRVATVDNFQGEEASVVIVSFVRSNTAGRLGFLDQANRINVLLSRAKHGMIIVGNADLYSNNDMWWEVIQMLHADGNFGPSFELQCTRHKEETIMASTAKDFETSGCSAECGQPLQCGHICTGKCHTRAIHNSFKCQTCETPRMPVLDKSSALTQQTSYIATNKSNKMPASTGSYQKVDRQLAHGQRHIDIRSKLEQDDSLQNRPHQDRESDLNQQTANIQPISDHATQELIASLQATPSNPPHVESDDAKVAKCDKKMRGCSHSCRQDEHSDECGSCQMPCESQCAHSKCLKKCSEPCLPCEQLCGSVCPHTVLRLATGRRAQSAALSPSVCGEACPEETFCQQCGPEEIKNNIVDLESGKKYREVDLDADPCIFPDCLHIVTISTFDKQLANYDHSIGSQSRGVAPSLSLTFSSSEVPCCDTCSGSLRKISRCGGAVRKPILDNALKHFISSSHQKLVKQELSLLSEQQFLEDDLPAHLLETVGRAGDLDISGQPFSMLTSVQRWVGPRYDSIVSLMQEINDYLKNVQMQEKSFQKIFDLIWENQKSVQLTDEESPVRLRFQCMLSALVLLVRCDIVIVADFSGLVRRAKESNLKLSINFAGLTRLCDHVIQVAQTACYPRHEVEAHILVAKMAVLTREVKYNDEEDSIHKLHDKQRAANHLQEALDIVLKHQCLMYLVDDIEMVSGQPSGSDFRNVASIQEKRAIWFSYSKEFNEEAKWHVCSNGHPFSADENMPQCDVFCPECDAPVVGRSGQKSADKATPAGSVPDFGGGCDEDTVQDQRLRSEGELINFDVENSSDEEIVISW